MTAPNPYAPPSDEASSEPRKRRRKRYTARMAGESLIVSREAALPAVCMKCGGHDTIVRRTTKFQWTPVWARFLVFCLIGAILALLTTKRATLDVPLCAPCNARWGVARGVAIGAVIALVASFLFMRFGDDAYHLGVALFFVTLAGFVAVSLAYVRPRLLRVQRIDDAELTFKGVAPSAAKEIVDGSK